MQLLLCRWFTDAALHVQIGYELGLPNGCIRAVSSAAASTITIPPLPLLLCRDTNLIVWGVDLVEEHLMTCVGIPARPSVARKPLAQVKRGGGG